MCEKLIKRNEEWESARMHEEQLGLELINHVSKYLAAVWNKALSDGHILAVSFCLSKTPGYMH